MTRLSYRERADIALWSGDPERVLDVAEAAYRASRADFTMVWGEIALYLTRQPVSVRTPLLRALPGRYDRTEPDSGFRAGLLHLAVVLAHDLPDDLLVEERRAALATVEHEWCYDSHTRLHVLAAAELDVGRSLSPPLVAVFRRSAELLRIPDVVKLTARLDNPVLNVGEPWADAALAGLPSLDPVWRSMLAHAATARSARPSGAWGRRGLGFLDRLGTAVVREQVLQWLALVGRPRSLPLRQEDHTTVPADELLDPWNANALRGLVWLLSLTELHEDTVFAMGALADACLRVVPRHGPRNPKVANAAVYALSCGSGPTVRRELLRLAGGTSYKGTLKHIDAALAAHGQCSV
ncbi:hypothetical protein [Streptomyces zhihengii]|uniref:hypothetical protein n=1 Tax=Streptomyces zhihengii TaxID=1818004 RepID=UPI0033B6EF23